MNSCLSGYCHCPIKDVLLEYAVCEELTTSCCYECYEHPFQHRICVPSEGHNRLLSVGIDS